MGRSNGLLVGRARERESLERVLEAACTGTACAVFLTGEPGIGKTHLLAELVRLSHGRGCLVLEGSAAEFEQALPFGVVIDALDAYVASLDPRAVDRLAADGLNALADVFPALRALRSGAGAAPTATERFRTYNAVRELLERLAATQPLVLVLDDLHWADLASIELVAHLLRRPPDAQVLLAGSFRSGQAHPALPAAIAAAGRAQDVELLRLGPLTPEEAEALVLTADVRIGRSLYGQSGGNPFYLLQLARVDARGASKARAADGDEVPPAVVAAIGQELAALSPATRAFADAAAVVGDPFELDLATATAGGEEAAALAALDELIAGDLVRPAEVPRRFRFRHPLVRAAVYQSSSTGTRLVAHARCAEALAAQGAPATTRAHHVEQSARRGDEGAVTVLREAGEATAQRLPTSAARWFQAALRLLPERAPVEDRIDLVMAAASTLTTAGSLPDARAVLLSGLDTLPHDAHEMRVRLTAACAGVEQQLGLLAEAHGRLVAALDELSERDSEAGVALMVALAADGFYQMSYDSMKDWGCAAATAAASLGNDPLTASAEAVLALACAFTMDREGAEEHRLAAAAIIDGMADEALAIRLDAVGHLAAAELYLERWEETAAHAGRGIAVARAAGRNDVFPTLFPCLGSANWLLGKLAESVDALDGAVEAARLTGNQHSVAWGLLNLSLAALISGDMDLALRTGQESVDLVGVAGDTHVSALAATILGWVLSENGEPARGAAMIVAANGGDALPRVPGGWRATYLGVLARCYLDLGRVDEAKLAAARAMAVSEEVGLPRTMAVAHRATAEVALHVGDVQTAITHARISTEAAERNSARVDAAISRVVLGRALAEGGDVEAAITELTRAASDFASFGAIRLRDQAERELRKLGHRVHRRTEPGTAARGMAALSGRELEVARLVVDRRTNPEIATALFLSLKTVETHVRNIFRKLDVASRAEMARVVERAAFA